MGFGIGQHGFVKIPFGPFSLPTKVTHVFFVGYELVALSDSHIGNKKKSDLPSGTSTFILY